MALELSQPSNNDDLLNCIKQHCQFDFSGYAPAFIERQLQRLAQRLAAGDSAALLAWLQAKPGDRSRQLRDAITVNVSSLFRDPSFFLSLRRQLLPQLAQRGRLDIWVAGCARGEEVYSLAIVLAELDLLAHSRIIATDLSHQALAQASSGRLCGLIASAEQQRYQQAGGRGQLKAYFEHRNGQLYCRPQLLAAVQFVQHGLPQALLAEPVALLICRNVLIYFGPALKQRAIGLFEASLMEGGFLCLGDTEAVCGLMGPTWLELETLGLFQRRPEL
ncbi:MAG: hypothetical protein OIF35_07205 [Cellvibrionaceae bacterium]|nr:hypothetical protein [Cellvibrionaceae bacterium]MCV6628033.1 hypothetical protein [Cellvibrionaceae bacterium]